MKRENFYYAVFAFLVIIFCVVTAMRVFAETLHMAKPGKRKHSDSINRSLDTEHKTNKTHSYCILRNQKPAAWPG